MIYSDNRAIGFSPSESIVTQVGRSGMRRAWPRALLLASLLVEREPYNRKGVTMVGGGGHG